MQMGNGGGGGRADREKGELKMSSDEGQRLKIGRKWQAEAKSYHKQAERNHRKTDSAFLCAFPK